MFPICVGMNRTLLDVYCVGDNVPHMCGDEPMAVFKKAISILMFPICVGMNRPAVPGRPHQTDVPHMCGDEPVIDTTYKTRQ